MGELGQTSPWRVCSEKSSWMLPLAAFQSRDSPTQTSFGTNTYEVLHFSNIPAFKQCTYLSRNILRMFVFTLAFRFLVWIRG